VDDTPAGVGQSADAPQTIEDLRRSEVWMRAQKQAFRAALGGLPLEECLDILVRTAVAQFDGAVRCGFWIADPPRTGLHHLVGLPADYARTIDGFAIGPDSLACGLAVGTNQIVITPDVLKDPRWSSWLWLASKFGYRGVWSFPVRLGIEDAIGTFALYFAEPREATARDYDFASVMTYAAAILISHDRRQSGGPLMAEALESANPDSQANDGTRSVVDAARSAAAEGRRLLAKTDLTHAPWRRYLTD
jgi:GAF domain-containing protein